MALHRTVSRFVAAMFLLVSGTAVLASSGLEISDGNFEATIASANVGGVQSQNSGRAACNTGPFIVLFDWNDSSISDEARKTLDYLVEAYANCGIATIALVGHTDTSQSLEHSLALAEDRNRVVAEYLANKGLPSSRMSAAAKGKTQPRVRTGDGVKERQNRRVEISFRPR